MQHSDQRPVQLPERATATQFRDGGNLQVNGRLQFFDLRPTGGQFSFQSRATATQFRDGGNLQVNGRLQFFDLRLTSGQFSFQSSAAATQFRDGGNLQVNGRLQFFDLRLSSGEFGFQRRYCVHAVQRLPLRLLPAPRPDPLRRHSTVPAEY